MLQEADLAAAPLTITSSRERVVDTTKPFMVSNIAAIMKSQHATQLGIHSVRDLARQSVMKYGVVDATATQEFFRASIDPDFERMWAEIATQPPIHTMEQGIRRVLASSDAHPWAFLSDSETLRAVSRCDATLTTVNLENHLRTLGLALPLGSPYKDMLNIAILQLRESGYLEILRTRWLQSGHCRRAAAAKRFLFPHQ